MHYAYLNDIAILYFCVHFLPLLYPLTSQTMDAAILLPHAAHKIASAIVIGLDFGFQDYINQSNIAAYWQRVSCSQKLKRHRRKRLWFISLFRLHLDIEACQQPRGIRKKKLDNHNNKIMNNSASGRKVALVTGITGQVRRFNSFKEKKKIKHEKGPLIVCILC